MASFSNETRRHSVVGLVALTSQQHPTRSQAVARITDRTSSQHLSESGDVIGHVTI